MRNLKRRRVFSLLISLPVFGTTLPFPASGYTNSNAKLGLDLHSTTPSCSAVIQPCNEGASSLQVSGDTESPYWVYVLVMDASVVHGISGVSFGIEYDGTIYVSDWQPCSDAQFPGGSWPSSGASNTLTWAGTNCQDLEVPSGEADGQGARLIGAFYLYAYSEGDLRVTGSTGGLQISDCEGQVSFPDAGMNAGVLSFGGGDGVDPCLGQPTQEGGGNSGSADIIDVSFRASAFDTPTPPILSTSIRDVRWRNAGTADLLESLGVIELRPMFPEFQAISLDVHGQAITLPVDMRRFFQLRFGSQNLSRSISTALRECPDVESVSWPRSGSRGSQVLSTDPAFSQQWWAHNTGNQLPGTSSGSGIRH